MIVAQVMDEYIMFDRKFVCKYIPPSQVHPKTFIGCKKKYNLKSYYNNKNRKTTNIKKNIYNLSNIEDNQGYKKKQTEEFIRKKQKKLREQNIDYDISDFYDIDATIDN